MSFVYIGLHLKDLLLFIEQYPKVQDYMPDKEEIVKAGREW